MEHIILTNGTIFQNVELHAKSVKQHDNKVFIKNIKLDENLARKIQEQLELQQCCIGGTTNKSYRFSCITTEKEYTQMFISIVDYSDLDVSDVSSYPQVCDITLSGSC